MLIEIHMIQNHSPSNLNRDDLGAPKTCVFGGSTRARISSQCLKRSIRRGMEFAKAMEKDGGIRTRRLITLLAEQAHGSAPAPADLIKLVTDAFAKGGVKKEPTKDDPDATNILLFIPESTLSKMADAVKAAKQQKTGADVLCEQLTELLGEKAAVPDIALCGRMTELDSDGLFAKVDFHVEAALSVAHAISTHKVINEVDYFTAVDDKTKGTGSAHLGEAQFASACFYKYFSLDWNQLVENLNGNIPLARSTVMHFLRGASLSTPSGKQKGSAAFNLPDGILVEVKDKQRTPISYANAFADPVNPKAERGLIGQSIACLGHYAHGINEAYGICANRFWFSPDCSVEKSYRLTWVDKTKKEHEQEQPVVEAGNALGNFEEFVKAIMAKVDAGSKVTGVKA